MAMKTVLVPIQVNGSVEPALETAHAFAARFDAYVEGVVLDVFASDFVAVDVFSGGWVPPASKLSDDAVRECRDAFENFMQRKSVPRNDGILNHLSFGWSDQKMLLQGAVAEYSRIFDVTVFGALSAEAHPMQQMALETTLFESGRPILIAPSVAPRSIGNQVLVAWNGSTETALTVALAMPILEKAKAVVVLTVEGGMVPGPSGSDLTRHLKANGIAADERTVSPGKRSSGEMILAEAASLGCDLIIKGAYTQSRLRQMIFGGATRHILSAAPIPVFMAH